MLKIRLQRVGRIHEPVFRLVLTDSKNSTKSGRFLEILGSYDSRKGDKAEFKTERISHWMSHGAQLSDTVHNILVSKKVITGKKINALPKKKPILKEGAETAASTPVSVAQESVPETPTESVPDATPESVEATA